MNDETFKKLFSFLKVLDYVLFHKGKEICISNWKGWDELAEKGKQLLSTFPFEIPQYWLRIMSC